MLVFELLSLQQHFAISQNLCMDFAACPKRLGPHGQFLKAFPPCRGLGSHRGIVNISFPTPQLPFPSMLSLPFADCSSQGRCRSGSGSSWSRILLQLPGGGRRQWGSSQPPAPAALGQNQHLGSVAHLPIPPGPKQVWGPFLHSAIGTCLIPSKPSDTQDSAKAASFALMVLQENQPRRNNSSFQAQDASFGPEQGQGYVLGRLTSTTSTMTCSADREAHTELQNFSI